MSRMTASTRRRASRTGAWRLPSVILNHVIRVKNLDNVLGICASTGDTSAAAALYLSYLPKSKVSAVVLLPKGKVTNQQLSQPLGSGARVIEMPGVFDDCMSVVEELAQDYHVFLLNSKNPVRILGTEIICL